MIDKNGILDDILQRESIYPVYQAIICLQLGIPMAYEALSRIENQDSKELMIHEVFNLAKNTKRLWELEYLCRQKALEKAEAKPRGTKLFLNIDPDTILNSNFKTEATLKQITKYGFEPNEIIFELSEQTEIRNQVEFKTTLKRYKSQKFQIAIDDFGSGYSGFNRIQTVHPEYIKIDISIVSQIEQDVMKQAIVESLVSLSQRIKAEVIAEGVETEAELEKLIELGVHYAQGYFIQRPNREFLPIHPEIEQMIREKNIHKKRLDSFGKIKYLAQPQVTVTADEKAGVIYEFFSQNRELSEYCIVHNESEVIGVITREKILELFSGRYGYNLHAKKPISQIMETDFFSVDADTTIEEVAKRAMNRKIEHVYNAVIVTEKRKYLGIVTIQKLLAATVEFQIKQAKEANPLTQMPGNNEIKRQIHNRIANDERFAVMYFDLDGFKAYNDSYGFDKGDRMIKLLAEIITKQQLSGWFSGHVGGDDFVVIGELAGLEQFCQQIFINFDKEKQQLYSREDCERGYIQAENRQGKAEDFPLVTISIAVITDESPCFQAQEHSIQIISEYLTYAKKRSKQQNGNSLVIL
ncbi:MAG: GGDEF domain-containing protein [Culicoidibacterales bacterium]